MDAGTASMAALKAWATVSRGRPVQQHRLRDLGRLKCLVVDGDEGLRRWEALLDAEHFLGAGPLVGRRLRYLVRSEHFGDAIAVGDRFSTGDRFPQADACAFRAENRPAVARGKEVREPADMVDVDVGDHESEHVVDGEIDPVALEGVGLAAVLPLKQPTVHQQGLPGREPQPMAATGHALMAAAVLDGWIVFHDNLSSLDSLTVLAFSL